MSGPRELLDALSAPFPAHAIKQRQGGGNQMFDYVETETVIRRLNATVQVWDFRITEIKVVEALLVVWGELTIPGLGTRSGTGVQQLRGGEDMWKGAASDCLKKCATLFNVGIDLYGPDLEAGELPASQRLPPRTRTTTVNTIPANEPVGTENTVTDWTVFWNWAAAQGFPRDKKQVESMIGTSLTANPAAAQEKVQAWMKDSGYQVPLAS